MTEHTDLTIEAFTILREHFFNQKGMPKSFPLREKRNTQDNPLDEYICGMLRNHLQDSECVPSPGPLISPDLVLFRPSQCNGVPRAALRNDLTRIVGIEIKKLERTKSGSVARQSGLDYNTTPPCGTIRVYAANDNPLDIRGFYLFVCQEQEPGAENTYQLSALALCDGNMLNEDFDLYLSAVGQREKEIGLGTYGNGANRHRPMFIFADPLGTPELDVIFRAIMGHVLSPKVGQGFSPKVGHLFSPKGGHSLSPKLGHDGAGEIPRHRAYFPLSNQREWEGTCLERGKKPWTFERS